MRRSERRGAVRHLRDQQTIDLYRKVRAMLFC
jgi:hypothetical protein